MKLRCLRLVLSEGCEGKNLLQVSGLRCPFVLSVLSSHLLSFMVASLFKSSLFIKTPVTLNEGLL